nr:vWA domain-containing protein [Propionicimonas sp.]
MQRWVRWSAAVLGVLAATWMTPAVARAETGVDEVVAALGLTSEPADYVVLVDTSGSMKADGRYARVRHELGTLIDGLDSDDRVSLLTFDSKAVRRFRGAVGENPSAVTSKLPATAAGDHTDIGAAIAAGLTELERPDTHRLAALILITDGKLDAPGSKYANVKSSAWKQLKARATELGGSHQVAAYAVSLSASTDAGLLKKVFPQATEVAASQVGAQFAGVDGDLIRLQAADVLRNELSQPIQVHWTGDLGAALADGTPVDAQVEIVSPFTHVPVKLTDLAVQVPPGLEVRLTGLPDAVVLQPGARVALPVSAVVTGSAGSGARVGLTATVSSSWRTAADGLGVEFAPVLEGTAEVPPAPIKLPPNLLPTIGAVLGLAVAALLLFVAVRALFTPSMSGLLSFRREGRELGDVVLKGRRMKLSAPEAAAELAGLSGRAVGARAAVRGEHAVRVDLRFGATSARGLVPDGGAVDLGDMEVAYTSGRRRILDKIGLPRTVDAAVSE